MISKNLEAWKRIALKVLNCQIALSHVMREIWQCLERGMTYEDGGEVYSHKPPEHA